MRKFLILIYLFFQALLSSVNAQSNYPVFVTPTLSPPYSLNLSDYSKFGSQKLMLTIHINDLNISNLPVKLRIKLETTGVTIENPATIATTPIYIDGGTASILFGNDLSDYFNINNLIFKGYSKDTYNRTGQLPEGFYRFTVEVLHFNTNRLISNQSTTTAWISLGKPPVLKLPGNNAEMGKFKGMPLTFSWLASNVGSPVSANTIQYKFEMWEMHVPGINPNVVAASMPVFHEHTDFNKMYSLYPINLLMKPGMQYAWRITSSDLSGFVPFEQNGHSEIRTFIYKAACDSITNLTSSHRGKNGLFSWNPEDNHTSFNVEMRNPETGWMTNSESFENKAEFFDLDYGATYEMRVQAVCDGDPDSKSDFSTWKSLTIPTPAPPDTADCPDCVCDDDIPAVELQNFDIRNDLQPGDTIINKTGTSRFILKTVEDQGGGVYKGIFLFWAEIWKLKFICNYWDLQVNTDDVIVNMDFESVYDPQFLVDVDATIDYLDSLSSIITTLSTDIEIDDTLSLDETINTIYVNEGDSVIVVTVDEEGNTTETVISDNVDDLEEILIEGENGEEYVVTNDGEVMGLDEYQNTGGGNNGAIDDYNEEKEENNLSEDITVNFTPKENQKFGFDQYSDEKINLQSKYPSFNNGYKPAYKSIASFSTDIVGVSNSGSNIIFKDEMGIPAIKTGEDVTLRGSSNGADVALYAYQVINDTIEKIAGKLNVLSFDEQAKQLYIVPVNGATTPDETSLQETLNKTYSQAITRWQVTKLENLSDIVFEESNMSHGGTTAISVYNKDQKTIVNTFEERVNKLENNAYYLFFVENVQFKDRSIAGYMPLQRQVGFIYDNPGLNIIAHELGHGAFNLWHTFSPDNFIATEHTTQNLLDYKGGTDLWKHQWQLVQSPDKMVFGWLQDESDGEFGITTHQNLIVEAVSRINGSFDPNEVNFKLLISTGLLADGGSILCEVNEGMSNAEVTEGLRSYLNTQITDLYRIFDSPYNVLREQWMDYWSTTSIEFPNMRNIFNRSWQYGSELNQSFYIMKNYAKAAMGTDVKFEKLEIIPNNSFKIEIEEISILEHPDLLFDLLFEMENYRMQDYLTVSAEIENLAFSGEGLDLIPQWVSSDIDANSQTVLEIKYVNKNTQKSLFKVTFDMNASLVNSVELVMSINDVPINFPLTCEKERIEIHFDNKLESSSVHSEWIKINDRLSVITNLNASNAIDLGLILHNVADFYSHSNFIIEYIRWWMEEIKKPGYENLKIQTLKPEHIPSYSDVINNTSNPDNLDWSVFWDYYKPIMKTEAWTMGYFIQDLNNEEINLPLGADYHDNVDLDSPESTLGGDKPHPAALCNYFQFARGAAYKHIYQILEKK